MEFLASIFVLLLLALCGFIIYGAVVTGDWYMGLLPLIFLVPILASWVADR